MASLPKAVAFRNEQGAKADPKASLQAAQRMAQQTRQAHEQTKAYVASQALLLSAMLNQSYAALAVDTTLAGSVFVSLVSTTIKTVLASGHIVVTFSLSGTQLTNASAVLWRVVVDGQIIKGGNVQVALNNAMSVSMIVRVPVVAGSHTVSVQVEPVSNSLRINASSNVFEHAHMLVQEAA